MKPTVPEVLPLARAVYARNLAGCCLHVVLDDGNVADSFAWACLLDARAAGHADCIALAEAVAQMSPTQRRKLGGLV